MSRLAFPAMTLAAVLTSLSPGAGAGGPDLSEVPIPPGARIARVGAALVHNGQPVSIATFDSAADVETTLNWYRQQWAESDIPPGYVERSVGHWRMIARLDDGHNIVLQLQSDPAGRSSGLLSILALDGPVLPAQVPVLPGQARLLSQTESSGGHGAVTTRLMRSVESPSRVAGNFRARLIADGWQLVYNGDTGEPAVMLMSRSSQTSEVVITADERGGSFIVHNTVGEAD